MKEIWKPIEGYEGLYDVSNYGRVRSYRKMIKGRPIIYNISQQFMNLHKDKNGYLLVSLRKNGSQKSKRIHRLVLAAFIGNCPVNMECHHLDSNPSNNQINNLKW